MKIIFLLTCLFVIGLLEWHCPAQTDSPSSVQGGIEVYMPAVHNVAIKNDSSIAIVKVAEKLASYLGQKAIWKTESNPICCVWLEVSPLLSGMGKPAYIVIFRKNGAHVLASDNNQLVIAVEHVKSTLKTSNGEKLIPVDVVLTNLKALVATK